MSPSESLQALRRANPRNRAGFGRSLEAVAAMVHAKIASSAPGDEAFTSPQGSSGRPLNRQRRLAGVSAAGVSLVAAAAVAVSLTIGSPGGGPGVESAAAAVRKAATVTAVAAERSGTAVVRMTHDGELWAETTIRWSGGDIAISREDGLELLVVDGTLYGPDVDGGWLDLGSPGNIDPDSGTTPDEYLAAVREDVGGATLGRVTASMRGLTTRQVDDGSTVYGGTVAAGLIARESGFKEGQAIRVFPFGYVAHDEAADPSAPLDVAVTVGADGIVREIAVAWGSAASAWTYAVTYSKLGATPAPVAPENAPSLEALRTTGKPVPAEPPVRRDR
jgi:hypothetical protein